jgi:hypothetical protein
LAAGVHICETVVAAPATTATTGTMARIPLNSVAAIPTGLATAAIADAAAAARAVRARPASSNYRAACAASCIVVSFAAIASVAVHA